MRNPAQPGSSRASRVLIKEEMLGELARRYAHGIVAQGELNRAAIAYANAVKELETDEETDHG